MGNHQTPTIGVISEKENEIERKFHYREAIGSLLYLANKTHTNL